MTPERKLKGRRRKFPKGRIVRLSNLVYETLDKQRRSRSWDAFFRRMLGLPDRHERPQPLVEGVLETMTGKFFLKVPGATLAKLEEAAYEVAFRTAAREKAKLSAPIKMREMP
jgi:hypothetical protein